MVSFSNSSNGQTVLITQGTSSNFDAVTIAKNSTGGGIPLKVTNEGTGASLYIDNNSTGYGLIVDAGNVGIGSTTPAALLSVNAPAATASFVIGSSTSEVLRVDDDYRFTLHADASMRFHNNAGTGFVDFFSKNSSDEIVMNTALNMEGFQAAEDAGEVVWFNLPVSSTPADGDNMSITYRIDNNNLLTLFGEADGTGGVDNLAVGIGTTSPYAMLSIMNTDAAEGEVIVAVATSTTGTIFTIDEDGDVFADGAYSSPSADYAEYYKTSDIDLESGEVVCVDVTQSSAVERCTNASDGNVMGIVSTNPAFVGNLTKESKDNENYKIIGMIGQLPTKVSTENGSIRPGDSLTSASIPGFAMRANAGDPTVGIALEGFSSSIDTVSTGDPVALEEKGTINVLVSRRNKSLTVSEIEQEVVDRIADMEIEDEVAILVASATQAYDFDPVVSEIIGEELIALEGSFGLQIQTLADSLAQSAELQKSDLDALKDSMTEFTLAVSEDLENNKLSLIQELEDGTVAINTNLTVSGDLELSGNLRLSGDLDISGELAVANTFAVAGVLGESATKKAFKVLPDGTVISYMDFVLSGTAKIYDIQGITNIVIATPVIASAAIP